MSAAKLLEKMRRTKTGFGQDDFRTLYKGFGFEEVQGGNHAKYYHPKYDLTATVGRHNQLATGYAASAVKLIDQLLALEAYEENNE